MAFKTKELIFIALMGALLFVVNFSIGEGIIAVIGIPGASGFVTGITNLIFITFVILTTRKFGTVTLLYLIYGILALPTNMAGGPPGFIWKIPALIITAFLFDLGLYLGNYKKHAFIFSLPIFAISGAAIYLIIYWLLGMPEFEKIIKAWYFIVPIFVILGYVGIWLGFSIYNRLKNKRILSQINA